MFFSPLGTIDLAYFKKIANINTEKQGSIVVGQDNLTNQQYLQLLLNTKCDTNESQKCFYQTTLNISIISQHNSLLNIVGLSYNDYNNQPYPTIFYEYYPNNSLLELISKRYSFSSTQKFTILLGIAYGMNHIYKNFLVHGDLKLNSVYLDGKLYPKLFGYKKTDTNNSVVKQDDIFRYGQIAFQLITGQICDKKDLDLALIENNWQRRLVERCMSTYRFHRPEFGQIANELLLNQHEFDNIEKSEVTKYQNLTERYNRWYIQQVKEEADQGVPQSIFLYGNFLNEGEVIPTNKNEALKYYKKAADQDFVPAMFNYAYLLSKGGFDIKTNKQEAAKYYQKSIEKGNKTAIFNYAHMLFNGDGVKEDKKEAARLYKLAADQGNVKAMFNFAQVLQKGEGIRADKKEAARYFKMAADQGNSKAMTFYALMRLRGEGGEVNKSEAANYFKLAADLGQVESMVKFAEMAENGVGMNASKELAMKYYKLAADNGSEQALQSYRKIVNNK